MTPTERYVVGIDYGTLSGRAVVVRVSDGAELASAVHDYRHAVLERQLPGGEPLGLDWALQVPADYVDVLRTAVPKAVAASGVSPDEVIGIATDFTACTVLPTLADGDEILVDRHDAGGALREGIYVLRVDGVLLVKRLVREGDGLAVKSDNPLAGPVDLAGGGDVVGRVLWTGRKL